MQPGDDDVEGTVWLKIGEKFGWKLGKRSRLQGLQARGCLSNQEAALDEHSMPNMIWCFTVWLTFTPTASSRNCCKEATSVAVDFGSKVDSLKRS